MDLLQDHPLFERIRLHCEAGIKAPTWGEMPTIGIGAGSVKLVGTIIVGVLANAQEYKEKRLRFEDCVAHETYIATCTNFSRDKAWHFVKQANDIGFSMNLLESIERNMGLPVHTLRHVPQHQEQGVAKWVVQTAKIILFASAYSFLCENQLVFDETDEQN